MQYTKISSQQQTRQEFKTIRKFEIDIVQNTILGFIAVDISICYYLFSVRHRTHFLCLLYMLYYNYRQYFYDLK